MPMSFSDQNVRIDTPEFLASWLIDHSSISNFLSCIDYLNTEIYEVDCWILGLLLPISASITLLMCLQESFWLYLATNGSISSFPRDIKKLCECVNKCWCKKKAKVFQLDLLVHMRKTKDYSICSSSLWKNLLTWVVNIQMSNL